MVIVDNAMGSGGEHHQKRASLNGIMREHKGTVLGRTHGDGADDLEQANAQLDGKGHLSSTFPPSRSVYLVLGPCASSEVNTERGYMSAFDEV